MTKPRPVKPPDGLADAGSALWRSVARWWADDELTPDPRDLRILADACREADLLARLEAALAEQLEAGQMVVRGSQGQPVPNGLIGETRRSRAQVAALLARIGFAAPEEDAPAATGHRLTSQTARQAALARWRRAGGA